ncbi:hypothetical protein OHA72_09690 [Dactylosporangium sp. NBC_01737]|uniref:hypothetical protein n=1 Tax=Dactylosporangium sp. NBC_01737 TaxID=2975959 RepID=UPI002E119CFE|nr:hypothetical protein OHA72_09690 [Dactylosporangium sp. NBC_01737]
MVLPAPGAADCESSPVGVDSSVDGTTGEAVEPIGTSATLMLVFDLPATPVTSLDAASYPFIVTEIEMPPGAIGLDSEPRKRNWPASLEVTERLLPAPSSMATEAPLMALPVVESFTVPETSVTVVAAGWVAAAAFRLTLNGADAPPLILAVPLTSRVWPAGIELCPGGVKEAEKVLVSFGFRSILSIEHLKPVPVAEQPGGVLIAISWEPTGMSTVKSTSSAGGASPVFLTEIVEDCAPPPTVRVGLVALMVITASANAGTAVVPTRAPVTSTAAAPARSSKARRWVVTSTPLRILTFTRASLSSMSVDGPTCERGSLCMVRRSKLCLVHRGRRKAQGVATAPQRVVSSRHVHSAPIFRHGANRP